MTYACCLQVESHVHFASRNAMGNIYPGSYTEYLFAHIRQLGPEKH
jgi:hypothetical protein